MTQKLTIKVLEDEYSEPVPFLKWVTDIVNKTPKEFLEKLEISTGSEYESYRANVVVTYERDETPEELAAAAAAQWAKAEASRLWTIEREKATLRALKENYPND